VVISAVMKFVGIKRSPTLFGCHNFLIEGLEGSLYFAWFQAIVFRVNLINLSD
jgi:hypothetical protein